MADRACMAERARMADRARRSERACIANAVRMTDAAAAGAVYFVIVFAAGFVLGVIRTNLVAPAIGDLAAVASELPFILGWSWMASGWAIGAFEVPSDGPARLAMGLIALALLLAAEWMLWRCLVARASGTFLARYRHPPALLGLAAQLVFAMFPLFH